jgi:hypothetical protein
MMSPREPANIPVAAAESFDRVGFLTRSSTVGWLVFVMS